MLLSAPAFWSAVAGGQGRTPLYRQQPKALAISRGTQTASQESQVSPLWSGTPYPKEPRAETRSPATLNRISQRITAWFARNARDLPWRRTRDPYAIWISEVMLQQTQVKTVIPYWERWMNQLPTIRSLAVADEQRVLKLWEGLGYYTRARNLQKAARLIRSEHSGLFPTEFNDILALPGIGRYTAGAICSIAYGQPAPILDGNVIRVLSRIFALPGDPKSRSNHDLLWSLSAQLVTSAAKRNACSSLNQGLMELGATICLPSNPLCTRCPVRSQCEAFRIGRINDFPEPPVRSKSRQRHFVAYLLRHRGKVLVRQRPGAVINAGLWEFPNVELLLGHRMPEPWSARGLPPLWTQALTEARRSPRLQAAESKAVASHAHSKNSETEPFPTVLHGLNFRTFGTIKHTITNNRITLRALAASVNGEARSLAAAFSAEWRPIADLHALPFTSAHGKLRARLMAATEL